MRIVGDISRLNGLRFPRKTALRFGGDSLTFAQADTFANRAANVLREAGVQPGDRVALLSLNRLDYLPLLFATAKCGALCVPLNFRCSVDELAFMLADSQTATLLVGPGFESAGLALSERVPCLKTLLPLAPTAALGARPSLRECMAQAGDEVPQVAVDEEDGVFILYTSGTTGQPKGVVLSHRSIVEGACQTALAAGVRHEDTALVTVPLFHGGGLAVVSMSHLYLGASLVIHEKFDPAESLAAVASEGVTTFFGVPSQLFAVLEHPAMAHAALGPLRALWYGAAPMPPVLFERLQQRLPGIDFVQTYGQTETTLSACLGPEEHRTKPGATGRELPGIEYRVVDDDCRDVPPGGIGEILVRRDTGMLGYYGNPEQTAATIRDGWIHTGDLARIDEDRYITVVDRKRDVILSGGENIYPKEIEDLLLQHPAVAMAAVIGVPDERWGEVPKAFVIRRDGAAAGVAALESWLLQRLARYKRPRHWEFVDALPQTATGKVRKNELRERERAARGSVR
ncbi:MAG: long-chain-fatty-acid--CoA ligase [Burkholderiaceae bacterium]|nr:long-chain-fatty-acid--CoA ligase [Burkholderiaceae bacterium]